VIFVRKTEYSRDICESLQPSGHKAIEIILRFLLVFFFRSIKASSFFGSLELGGATWGFQDGLGYWQIFKKPSRISQIF
jgi:hypothetical protein